MENDPGFRYPPPSHALTLWFTGNALAIAIPPSGPDARGHTVMLPLEKCQLARTEGGSIAAGSLGWATLLSLLQARMAAAAAESPRIGTAPAPSLWQIEQALKASGQGSLQGSLRPGSATRKPRATTLSDLGLD
jgi:hypothetical protein